MSIIRLSVSAGFALIAIGLLLYFTDTPRDILGEMRVEQEQNAFPYAFANNAATRYYNEDGSLNYTFESKKLRHFRPDEQNNEGFTSMESPSIVVYHAQEPWRVTADNGRVHADKSITLEDNVKIFHVNVDGYETTMLTSTLMLDPKSRLARTDEAVTIDSPLGSITAIGMIADLSTKNIKLLRNVKGRHEPANLGQ